MDSQSSGVLEPLLSAREVADYLGVHLNTVHRMILAGHLPGYKVERDWRVRPSDLSAYLAERAYQPPGRPT
jgi:excisionase family DNA binding protein